MGSPPWEGRSNERPLRWVHTSGFYIADTETTCGLYKRYLAESADAPRMPDWYWTEWGKTDQYAITWVTWDEAVAFCRWLSRKTGAAYRLPTEAEWEKAARGFTHNPYPWGDSYDGTQSGSPNETYLPVKSKPLDVSPLGVYDMAGNVWEWCADWYAEDAYARMPARNPTGPAEGTTRVLRSCGWNFDPDTFRITYRSWLAPGERFVHIGFRVVRELDPKLYPIQSGH
jgi:formylglycine-generating enzyme required for sulfatase activity